MRIVRLRPLHALVMGVAVWGVAPAPTTPAARAADRGSTQILAELETIEIPKFDPSHRGDTQAMTEYLLKRKAAIRRRGELTLELFRAAPDNPKLAELFSERWQNMFMGASDSPIDPKLVSELADVMGKTKDLRLKAHAAFYKTILEVESGEGKADEILKKIETFIQIAPKDDRGAMLLFSVAGEVDDPARQAEIYRRIIRDYPDNARAEAARASLKSIESIGKPFSLAFADAISGAPVSIESLRGKVVVLDFWATWCGPCVQEMPAMKELYGRYHGQGVEFIGVSLDDPKEEGGLDKLKAFVARQGINWPQYYQGKGWESEFSSSWGITSIPALFVVDQDGKLFSTSARGRLEEIFEQLLAKGRQEKPRQ